MRKRLKKKLRKQWIARFGEAMLAYARADLAHQRSMRPVYDYPIHGKIPEELASPPKQE